MSDEPGKISFEFVTAPMIRCVLSDYFAQASKALVAESYLGAVVGFGAVVEGLLIWALQQRDAQARATTAARNYRAEPIERWKLEDLIDVSKELGVIDEPEHAVRDWRNLVHPYRRVRGSPRFDHALALSALRAVARIVHRLGGNVHVEKVSASEMKFSWLLQGQLAGCRGPSNSDELAFLVDQQIAGLVRLAEANRARVTSTQVGDAGLEDCHVPVKDFYPPDMEEIDRILAFVDAILNRHSAVAVSCGAGYGRTGTVLACFLVRRGHSVESALAALKETRPDSEAEIRHHPSGRQLNFLFAFERRTRGQSV